MKIVSIFILHRSGHADIVSLHTDLPAALWPFTDTLDVSFTCVVGGAERYVEKHWPGVPIEVVTT
jgi:hypothetical protein